MLVSKMRLLALGLSAAGFVAAGVLTSIDSQRVNASEPATTGAASGEVHVDAPGTWVNVDKEHGRVSVAAPYTNVWVDPDKGRVRVRAPYVNLDVDW